jgi:hypothetical protein
MSLNFENRLIKQADKRTWNGESVQGNNWLQPNGAFLGPKLKLVQLGVVEAGENLCGGLVGSVLWVFHEGRE